MDSPEPAKLTSSTGLDSPPVQDSPFFNFISSLSPIKPVKSTAHAVQELAGLSSPPIVFKTPRTKQPSETNVLKRSQSLQLSVAEASQNVDRGKDCVDGSVDSEQFISICQDGLVAETQKDCNVDEFSETNPSSSSGCIDEFLADPGGADCVNSTDSATPTPKKYNNASKASQSGSKETRLELDDRNDARRKVGTEQGEKNIHGKPTFDAKSIGTEKQQRDGEWSSYGCLITKTNLHVGPEEDYQNSQAQDIGRGHQNDFESTSQPSAEPFHVQPYEDLSEDVGEFSDGLAESIMLRGDQGSENQRGMLRRCLQFEEAPRHNTGPSDGPLSLANTVQSLRLSTSDAGLENLKSCHVELKENCERQMVNFPQSTPTLLHPRSSEKFPTVSKPLGIGLHLNSIVNAASVGCTANAGKKSTDHYKGMQRMKSGMASYNLVENTKSCSMSSSVVEKDSASSEERTGVIQSSIIPSSVPNDFLPNMEDHFAAPDETGKSNSPNADGLEEHDQLSPRKKRKKTKSTGGGDGCKRCNCKKTKCLKLYCDCFAAGVYCTDPCSCQGCFNRPEYEKTVVETRELIESRNPIAFAPKIVQHIPELPPNHGEDGDRLTPSSARHKRGCNCKKSMCLKKYCECYQANVGCSTGCRCEGCKNVYGRKEEYAAVEHGVSREIVGNSACAEKLENTFDKELEMAEPKRELLCNKSISPHNLTPLTPSFQHSDHGKEAPKSRFLSRRYLPSPDFDLPILSSNEKTKSPPRDSEKSDVLLETNEFLDESSYDWQVDHNQGIVDSTSCRRDSVPSVPHLIRHPNTSMPMISSTSFRKRNCRNLSQNQLCPGSDHLSSNPTHGHGSPLTPMSRLCATTRSHEGPDSGSVQLVDILEDETPVKVSSPNKKRVSPPHSHIFELGSGSSGKLKSGRKFILKSVPSFPPLTPCIDSKGSTAENTDKLQDDSGENQNVMVNP